MTAVNIRNSQSESMQTNAVQLTTEERELVHRIKDRATTRQASPADIVRRLLSTPLGFI